MNKEISSRLVIDAIRYMILEKDMRGGIVRLLRFLEVDNDTLEKFRLFDYDKGRSTLLAKLDTMK